MIYLYPRAAALADGRLIDINEIASKIKGYRVPVAVTPAVNTLCMEEGEREGISHTESIRKMLKKLKPIAERRGFNLVPFTMSFGGVSVELISACFREDINTPLITILTDAEFDHVALSRYDRFSRSSLRT